MKVQIEVLLLAAAAASIAARPAAGEETLVVSPLVATSPDAPPEPGSLDPLPGSDAWIAARVEDSFLAHRSAAASDAEIAVREGVVRLGGAAANESGRAEASAYARTVPGVRAVVNRMKVAGTEAAVRSTALDRMDDAAATLRVKAALLRRRPGAALKTRVATRDGVVTLRGRVEDASEREAIEAAARELDGIAAVDDRLTTAR